MASKPVLHLRLHGTSLAVGAGLGIALALLVRRLLRSNPSPSLSKPVARMPVAPVAPPAVAASPQLEQIVALLQEAVASLAALRELAARRTHDNDIFLDASDIMHHVDSRLDGVAPAGVAVSAAVSTGEDSSAPATAVSEADQLSALFAEVDARTEKDDGAAAGLELEAQVAAKRLPRTEEVLWRLARGLFHQSVAAKNSGEADSKAREQALLEQAVATATEALSVNEACAFAHKWFAISNGSLTAFVPTKEKIALGFVFKKHVQRAIELAPHDPTNYYLLGRWCFEVASLSWFEKKAAAALFAAPPEATFDETLELFEKAEQLRPNQWKANKYMLGKTLLKLGRPVEARHALQEALQLPVVTADDVTNHADAEALFATL